MPRSGIGKQPDMSFEFRLPSPHTFITPSSPSLKLHVFYALGFLPEAGEAVAEVAVHLVQAGPVVEAGRGEAVVDVHLAPRPGEACGAGGGGLISKSWFLICLKFLAC
jgi:hypothetical protein